MRALAQPSRSDTTHIAVRCQEAANRPQRIATVWQEVGQRVSIGFRQGFIGFFYGCLLVFHWLFTGFHGRCLRQWKRAIATLRLVSNRPLLRFFGALASEVRVASDAGRRAGGAVFYASAIIDVL